MPPLAHAWRRPWKWHHSIDPYDFLLAVHSNYGPILYRIRDKTRQSQNGIFFIPRLRNNNGCEHFRAVFFHRSMAYQVAYKYILQLSISQLKRVRDGRTEKRFQWRRIY